MTQSRCSRPAAGGLFALVCLGSACSSGALSHRSDASSDAAALPDAVASTDAAIPTADADVDAAGCATLDLAAAPTTRPIDVIVWVDDGGSFAGERAKVARSIGVNLADILDAAHVDYQIVLLSSATSIPEPLRSSTRFFHAPGGYSAGSGGYVFFSSPTYLANYVDHLRTDAFKVFLSATDCEGEAGTFDAFEMALTTNAPTQFVSGDHRNFAYDMIGNLALRTPSTAPYTPTDASAARGSFSGGRFSRCVNTQAGAIETGGLRLGVDAPDYDALFMAIAELSIGASRLPCSFAPPPGELDLHRIRFRYQPGDGSMEQAYRQVADAAACGPAGGFYLDGAMVQLCPSTCDLVSADATGMVHFTFECGLH